MLNFCTYFDTSYLIKGLICRHTLMSHTYAHIFILCFDDFVEGISEIHFKPIKSNIYPNPSTQIFTIEFDNPNSELFGLSVYNIQSKLVLKNDNITDNKITIDARLFQEGIYIYKLTNLKARKRCWGKFIIAE